MPLARVEACELAEFECTGSIDLEIYINGIFKGACGQTYEFQPRGIYTDTLTIYNAGGMSRAQPPVDITVVTCNSGVTSFGVTSPTPTPWIMHPPSQTFEVPGESQIMGGGGSGLPLPNFYASVETWLGIGKDTVDLINSGNLLYVLAAISVAGMVLSWAINQIKNPR